MEKKKLLLGISLLALCIGAVFVAISDDTYASSTGSANVPLTEIDTDAYDLVMSGSNWYIYPNSPVTVIPYSESNISAEVTDVTAGYGLTVTDGTLSGTVIGSVTITVYMEINGDPMTYNILLTAENLNVYRIVYDANEGAGTMRDSLMMNNTSGWGMMFLADCGFTREGYTFTGWLIDSTLYTPGQSISVNSASPKVAVAQWSQDPTTTYTHTIAYHPGYMPNEETMSNSVVTDGISGSVDVTLSACTYTREGYVFVGWTRNVGDSTAFQPDMSLRVPGNTTTTVYAKWVKNPFSYTHTLQFDPQGGTGSMSAIAVTDNLSDPAVITLPSCTYTREGYAFAGWRILGGTYLNNNSSYIDLEGVVLQPNEEVFVKAGTVALAVAEWENTGATYTHTITYDGNGGIGTMEDTVVTDHNSGDTLVYLSYNQFYNSGRTFDGWLVNGVHYYSGERVPVGGNSTVTAVAQWTQTYDHTIIYNGNGGSGFMNSTKITDENSGVTNVPLAENGYTKTNAIFVGWLVGEDILQPGDLVPVTGGSAVGAIAQWQQAYSHTITYASNGGSGTMSDTVVTDNVSGETNVTLAENGFTKADSGFTGWLVDGITYQPGQAVAVMGGETVTATAQWDTNTLTVTAGDISGYSQNTYTTQVIATVNNVATISYAIASSTGGTASVNTNGLVTYVAPSVSVVSTYTVTVMVTATFSNQVISQSASFTATIQPIASGVQIRDGTPEIDSEKAGDGYHITDMSFNGLDCDFFIGPQYSETYEESILDDAPQVGILIGIIPLLLITGMIVYIARNMTVSRR